MKLREITERYIHFFINPLNFSSCLEFTVCHYCCHQIKHFRCHQFPFPPTAMPQQCRQAARKQLVDLPLFSFSPVVASLLLQSLLRYAATAVANAIVTAMLLLSPLLLYLVLLSLFCHHPC